MPRKPGAEPAAGGKLTTEPTPPPVLGGRYDEEGKRTEGPEGGAAPPEGKEE